MMDVVAIVQKWLMMACFVILSAVGVVFSKWICETLTLLLRKMFSRGAIMGTLAVVGVVIAARYAVSKSWFRFDAGLTDNGSYTTNSTVHVAWAYSGIPSASTIYIDYRLSGTTNEWQGLAETYAYMLEWGGTIANATNYDFYVYSTYIPPVPVHTNGVWVGQVYETKARVGAKSFLIINGRLTEHGKTVAPPSAKRKEEQ